MQSFTTKPLTYLLSTYCVPSSVLGAWNTSVNKRQKSLVSLSSIHSKHNK